MDHLEERLLSITRLIDQRLLQDTMVSEYNLLQKIRSIASDVAPELTTTRNNIDLRHYSIYSYATHRHFNQEKHPKIQKKFVAGYDTRVFTGFLETEQRSSEIFTARGTSELEATLIAIYAALVSLVNLHNIIPEPIYIYTKNSDVVMLMKMADTITNESSKIKQIADLVTASKLLIYYHWVPDYAENILEKLQNDVINSCFDLDSALEDDD
jgi:hypothetical protein